MFAFFAAAAAVGVLGELYEQHRAAQSEEAALATEDKEQDLSYTQKQINNYTKMQSSLSQALAQASVSGFDPNSSSNNAIARTTYSVFGQQAQNLDAEKSLTMANLDIEKQSVRNQFYGQVFGDVGQAASAAAGIYSNMPMKSASTAEDSDPGQTPPPGINPSISDFSKKAFSNKYDGF